MKMGPNYVMSLNCITIRCGRGVIKQSNNVLDFVLVLTINFKVDGIYVTTDEQRCKLLR